MYTVVNVNPNIHVHKISDVDVHTRVVHKDFLLDVNFQPHPVVHSKADAVVTDFSLHSEDSLLDNTLSETAASLSVIQRQDGLEGNIPHVASTDAELAVYSSPVPYSTAVAFSET